MGLAMQLIPQEWPHWLPVEPPGTCAQYHRPRASREPETWVYWQMAPGVWVNQWREACDDWRLLSQLQTLPADVYKVEAGKQLIALYWAERGDVQVLQRIASVLKALA
ncbi:hypothetical protein EC915_101268 [Pseudomonas sp. LP_7_YM]|nr:hypothetical protein EC915_101268 [Pseudomonas sp. LP_7_YM]